MDQETLYLLHREKRMEEAVYVAAELFLKDGIESVKMTDVADAAAMGVASLYRYFGSKNVLVIRAGALLWRDVRTLYKPRLDSAGMAALTGLDQIRLMFSLAEELYRDHRAFISFVGELDEFLKDEELPPVELVRYQDSLLDYYAVFRAAFEKGVADGSIRPEVDPELFFRTISHSAMALELKLIRGALLPDDRLDDPGELRQLLDFGLAYLAAR